MIEKGTKGNDEYLMPYRVYTSIEWRERDGYDDAGYVSTVCSEIDDTYRISDHLVVLSLQPIEKGWIIHEKDCVLDELKLVRDKCVAANIQWIKST